MHFEKQMDRVQCPKCLTQSGTCNTNLEEQFMEFNQQSRDYKLYGVEGFSIKKNILQIMKKTQEIQKNIKQ